MLICIDIFLLYGNNASMNIQTDVKIMLKESGWSQGRLAREAELNPSALSKFMGRDEGKAIAERLWPYIYGDKRPPAKHPADTPPEVRG